MSDAKPYTLVEAKVLSQSHYGADPARVRATVEALEKAEAELSRKELERWNWEQSATHRSRERDEAWKALDAIAVIPEVDAAEGGEDDAVRNALAKLKAERDEARAEVARLQDLHTRCAAFDDQPGPACVALAADSTRLREALEKVVSAVEVVLVDVQVTNGEGLDAMSALADTTNNARAALAETGSNGGKR